MTNEEIQDLIQRSKKLGHEVTMKDISYVVLRNTIHDVPSAYYSLYSKGTDEIIGEYDRSKKISYLKNEIFPPKRTVSFEENREQLIVLLDKIKQQADTGEIKAKDAVAQEAAIRVQLERTFSTGNKEDGNQIIVESKFDDVCPYCHHEIALPPKERAMEVYNLMERD